MNYSTLLTLTQQFIENYESSFVAAIPQFVRQVEQRVYNFVQPPALRKTATLATVPSVATITTPADFLYPFSLGVTNGAAFDYVVQKDDNFLLSAYGPASTGVPKYYSLRNANTIAFGPTPNAVYSVTLNYAAYPQSIVDAGTSWLGDNFDPVLLYGTLVEAAIYSKAEQDVINEYKQKYNEALMQMKQLADGKLRGDAYRDGQVKVKVI